MASRRPPPKPAPKPRRTAEEQERARADQLKRDTARKRLVMTGLRDIAPIPPVANTERRAACASSLRAFCDEYFPATFCLPWSEDHLRVIGKMERCVLDGGLSAVAMPRGSGKTSLVEAATIWATLYGHRQYPVIIGADQGSSSERLESIKTELETNDALLDDFPEVCYPIRCLEGIAHRAAGQLVDGVSTRIGWTASEILLPVVKGSAASGAAIQTTSITGGIRGMKIKRADGRTVRPDLAIIDDPQTDASAKSPSQCEARLAVLTGAILGLAGPGKKIAAVMPCTVIAPGDMADRILDPQLHPEWNGERTKMVYAWPTSSKLWEEYVRIRGDSLRAHGTIKDATAFYAEHRAEMDAGARVAWPERFGPGELSAIQNAMELRLQDEPAFFAEYQNEPLASVTETEESPTSELVMTRLNGLGRSEVPPWATRLTGFQDVGQRVLWWGVVAWDDECNGAIIDYGTFPDQNREYFTNRDVKITLGDVIQKAGLEAQIAGGLDANTSALLGRRFHRPDGGEMAIDRMLIDANWGNSTDTVYDFCRRSPHAALLLPSHGRYVGASSKPMAEWKREKGERLGHNWRVASRKRGLRAVTFDSNAWKSFIAERFLTKPGDPGSLTLFGKSPERHRMIGDQIAAEYRVLTGGRGRAVSEWKLRPGRDNHLWDVLVGCAVAASIHGMPPSPPRRVTGAPIPAGTANPKADRMSFAALQRAARDRKS